MSEKRKVAPSLRKNGEFYDKDVQKALERGAERLPIEQVLQTYWLLSDLGFVKASGELKKRRAAEIFLELYFQDRAFFLEILSAIENARKRNYSEASASDLVLFLNDATNSPYHKEQEIEGEILQHKELAYYVSKILKRETAIKIGAAKMFLSREAKRRARIDKKWDKNFRKGNGKAPKV